MKKRQRSALPGLHATLHSGVRAEKGTIPTVGVRAAAALRTAVPGPTGRTAQRSAFPCLRATLHSGVRAEKGMIPTPRVCAAAALQAAVPV